MRHFRARRLSSLTDSPDSSTPIPLSPIDSYSSIDSSSSVPTPRLTRVASAPAHLGRRASAPEVLDSRDLKSIRIHNLKKSRGGRGYRGSRYSDASYVETPSDIFPSEPRMDSKSDT